MSESPRSTRRRRYALLPVVAVALWVVASGWLLHSARAELAAGRRSLEGARRDATAATLLDPTTDRSLAGAEDHFAAARNHLRSPILAPWRVLPVAGRQVRAADRVVASASSSAAVATDAVAGLEELAERQHPAGPERVRLLRDLATVATRAERGLTDVETMDTNGLIGPLVDAVTEVAQERREARRSLRRVAGTATALADVFAGPSRYLLLGANNAEMRAGSGMFLSAATLHLDDGRIALDPVRPTADLDLAPGSVPASGDLARNWPWLEPGRDLRNLGLTADFPQSAALAAANWAKVPDGGPVAGVLVVDVDALRALLHVVGPVEVDGVRYTADSVRGELLRRQYTRFDGDRAGRRDQIGAVAEAVLARIEEGEWAFEDLAAAVVETVQGRHLLAWAKDPDVQEVWVDAGASGALDERTLSVALVNRGAEKLDSYLATSAVATTRRRSDGRVALTLRYTVRNDAPASGPSYLLGPNIQGMAAGEHRGIVLVNLPAGSSGLRLEGARTFLLGGDGPTAVLGAELSLLRGEDAVITVRAVLPKGLDEVRLEPSARIPHTSWQVDGSAFERERRRSVPLPGE